MTIAEAGQEIQEKKHYVYVLKYPDDWPDEQKAGVVFYVGKGSLKSRIDDHERETHQGINSYKCNVIRKIERSGYKISKSVVAVFDTNEDACLYEIALIILMRPYGHLTNCTDGGEGVLGYRHSDKFKQWQSERVKGNQYGKGHTMPAAVKSKLSVINKGNKYSLGIIRSEESKRKQSETRIGKPWSTLQRAGIEKSMDKMIAVHIKTWGGFISPEGRKYAPIINLALFCREHNLDYRNMIRVNAGIRAHHKGWKRITAA